MTVETVNYPYRYATDGVSTAYAIGYFLDDTHIVAVFRDSTGADTSLVLNVDYTLSGAGNVNGGTLTATPALAASGQITIAMAVPGTQLVELEDGGDWPAATINLSLDKLTLLSDQALDGVSRSLRFPVSDDLDGEFPDAATRRGTLVGFTDDTTAQLTLITPDDQSASALALLLAGSGGAAAVGVTPVGGIASTDVQAALAETDSEWRAASSSTNGNVAAIDTRVDALEAAVTTGWIGKDTLAHLNADLAHNAGAVALVTNDGANDGYYLKLGASGAGSWQASDLPPWSIDTEAMALLSKEMDNALAVFGDTVVAMKIATDRWLVRTPVSGGEAHDYCEYEMFDMGAYMSITHAFGLHSIRAQIGGVTDHFMEQSATPGNVSTNEFAIRAGHTGDPLDDAHFGLYGIGHGHLAYLGLTINLDGGGTNYRDYPVGTKLSGTSFVFNASFTAKLIDGTSIGTVALAHIFDTNGLRISHQHVIGTANISQQNSYSGMLAATGVNRIKPVGVAETVIGAQDGSQTNFGQYTTFAMYYASRPTHLLELSLPTGAPGNPPNDWSYDTTTKTFLLDNANGIRKLYVNWSSGAAARAYPVGTYSFLTKYQARLGAAT